MNKTNLIDKEANKAKRDIIELFLSETSWNISQTARELGIDRPNLHRYMRKFGLERPKNVRVWKF